MSGANEMLTDFGMKSRELEFSFGWSEKMEPSSAESKLETIKIAVEALVRFTREFNRDLTPSILAELYLARELDSVPAEMGNHPGYDLLGGDGKRHQVKQRGEDVLNVDVNNFDFDFLALVSIADDYALKGTWLLPVEKAKELFIFREKLCLAANCLNVRYTRGTRPNLAQKFFLSKG
ncbi:MAG TPA: hypothetical protein VGD60_01625 [Candidatus Acidoferrales bacterium]